MIARQGAREKRVPDVGGVNLGVIVMQFVPAQPLVYEFSRLLSPRCRVLPGEVIQVETEDALSGQIRRAGDRRDKSLVPYSNPVSGPIFVEGAEVGDELAVTIEEITSRDGQCATWTGAPGMLAEWLGNDVPHGAHVCPIRDGQISWKDRLTIPYQPMLGCIGTAPDWGVPTTLPAGVWGGNLDLVEVCPGSTVYLPVRVPGGYLYVGDAHAAMGHGELSCTGLEMAAISTLRVELRKRPAFTGLRISHPEFLLTAATRGNHERSMAEAFSRLILWLEAEYGWNRWDAYDLLTHT
ncbi:MAG: Formamidase, partial [Planctomycetota bacterium]